MILSPCSLSRAGIWRSRLSGAASFPTLFSTASGVSGLVAGPSSVPYGTTEVLSEAFKLASADGCATGLRTRCRHGCDTFRVFTHLPGDSRHCYWRVCPEPRVSPLNSQVAFHSQSSGVVFNIASLRKVFTGPAEAACPSRSRRSLCPAFRRLSFGGCPFMSEPPEPPVRADTQ
jgi:hypothetical protein